MHSCERHCGAELITIDGDTVPSTAIDKFMAGSKRLWLQKAAGGTIPKFPCKTCCNDGCCNWGHPPCTVTCVHPPCTCPQLEESSGDAWWRKSK